MTQAANLAALGSNTNTTGILPAAGGGTAGTAGVTGFKNRVINGAMNIAQRGTSTTLNGTGLYAIDRFRTGSNGSWSSGVFAATQSSNAPAGFTNSLGLTVSTADSSPSSGTAYTLVQWIEGYNIADLGWGTANAQTVTLSFWVRSSLTGTFSGSLQGAASANRGYFFTYSIAAANTWTYCTVTVPGDGVAGAGAYSTTNGLGIGVRFSLGAGSSCLTSAGSWITFTTQDGVTGQTNLVATNGATWYVTGVQLEVGSTATNFDVRSYGTELALCQRYYFKNGGANQYVRIGTGPANTTTAALVTVFMQTPMRAQPSSVTQTGAFGIWAGATVFSVTGITIDTTSTSPYTTVLNCVTSGLSVGTTYQLIGNNDGTAAIGLSAEL